MTSGPCRNGCPCSTAPSPCRLRLRQRKNQGRMSFAPVLLLCGRSRLISAPSSCSNPQRIAPPVFNRLIHHGNAGLIFQSFQPLAHGSQRVDFPRRQFLPAFINRPEHQFDAAFADENGQYLCRVALQFRWFISRHSGESRNPGILAPKNPVHPVHPCKETAWNGTLPGVAI